MRPSKFLTDNFRIEVMSLNPTIFEEYLNYLKIKLIQKIIQYQQEVSFQSFISVD